MSRAKVPASTRADIPLTCCASHSSLLFTSFAASAFVLAPVSRLRLWSLFQSVSSLLSFFFYTGWTVYHQTSERVTFKSSSKPRTRFLSGPVSLSICLYSFLPLLHCHHFELKLPRGRQSGLGARRCNRPIWRSCEMIAKRNGTS